ncbi:MAG TPA: hypothetical protein VHU83_03195 [Bryobacteraceae bacterium]|jgi:hypothetical protein|nr:hypothetical protein [Bryobacteraceae bacterium]
MFRRTISLLLSTLVACLYGNPAKTWRAATGDELRQVIPARAQVEKERIETEFRTASGITDGNRRFVAGVVLITAGYAAEGKYSNFVIAQVPIKIEVLTLRPGTYVFGWKHSSEDALEVSFYEAQSGKPLGSVEAKRISRMGRIESFHISPPGDRAQIQIGRFAMVYKLINE